MPKGIPVATVAIGTHGAANAAYLAAQILSLESEEIVQKLVSLRKKNSEAVVVVNEKLE